MRAKSKLEQTKLKFDNLYFCRDTRSEEFDCRT